MSQGRAWLGFTAMAVGMFLSILDIQVVASSLVDIQADLRIPADLLSYLQTTYLIAEVIAIAITGWLTRALSLRWMFTGGLIGFVCASVACAAAPNYPVLYVFRFVQGLFGGVLVPSVFSAILLMFPVKRQGLATTIGGGFAMLAPTLGPVVGGWITETLSWHWLFLINVGPGLCAAVLVATLIRVDAPDRTLWRRFDWITLLMTTVCLSALELLLKEAPHRGWLSLSSLMLAMGCLGPGWIAVQRCRHRSVPLIDLSMFAERSFVIGAMYSFVLGMGLYGATYLLPLFLGIVRAHGPLEIGTIMVVAGSAQLLSSPVATQLEHRIDARWLTAFGYALIGAGLMMNGFSTPAWDFKQLILPQVLRGAALLFCLLPTTRLALGALPPSRVPQGSCLFNLMRNVGGALGLALIDTVVESRTAHHVTDIVARLQAGDRATAAFVGLPLARFHGVPLDVIDETTRQAVEPLVKAAALTASFNDAWLMLGVICLASLILLPFVGPRPPQSPAPSHD